jgi:hypothetical protein
VTREPKRERLGQLAANGPGADDGEARRQLSQREYGFVRKRIGFAQSRNQWQRGPPARANSRAAKTQSAVANCERFRCGKSALPEKNVDPQAAKPEGAIMGRYLGTQSSQALHDGGKIDVRAVRHDDAELSRVAHLCGRPRCPQECLRRHTANVEAVAAHQLALDQRHFCAKTRRACCGDQTGRAGAENNEVVSGRRFGIDPIRRMHVSDEPRIVGIMRQDVD